MADTLPKVVVPTTYPTHWLQNLQFSGIQCANENSDEDYLNDVSLEYENISRKGNEKLAKLNEKLTKTF